LFRPRRVDTAGIKSGRVWLVVGNQELWLPITVLGFSPACGMVLKARNPDKPFDLVMILTVAKTMG